MSKPAYATSDAFTVVWSDEDGAWIATDPGRPGLLTHAEHLADLPAMVADARACWDAMEEERMSAEDPAT